jgi:hypothetical protein
VNESDARQSAAHRTVHNRIIFIHGDSLGDGTALANFFLSFFSLLREQFLCQLNFYSRLA